MTDVIQYVRWSSKRQEKGDSLERQQADCRTFALNKGWTIVEEVIDKGRSAWTGDHLNSGNLGKLADRIRGGELPSGTIILVEKLDRLSRLPPKKTRRWLEDMTEAGAIFATVSPDKLYDAASFDGNNLMDFLEVLMGAKAANDYSENLSHKVGASWGRKIALEKGPLITRKVPGWIDVDKAGVMSLNHHHHTVRRIYQLAADGLGVRAINKKFNDEGVPAWGRVDAWNPSNVRHVLVTPSVEGDYLSGGVNPHRVKNPGVFHPGYYPRAVPADLVAKARAKMAGRMLTGGRESSKAVNLFSGLIICDRCESRMYLRSLPNGSRVYQCSNANQRRGCPHNKVMNYDAFEQAALDAVLKHALDDRFFKQPEQSLNLVHAVADQKKVISDKETLAANAYTIYLKHPDNPMAEARFNEVSTELADAKAHLTTLEEALGKARGWVSPAEHAQRVLEVRDAISSPEKATREAARLKVMDALKGVVFEVRCDPDERTFAMSLVGNAIGYKFDHEGNTIASFDLTKNMTEDYRNGITALNPTTEAMLDAVIARRDAVEAG